MKLGIRAKLFLISFALLAGALIAADLLLTRALDRILTERIKADLLTRASLVQAETQRLASAHGLAPAKVWEDLANDLATRTQARLTLIDLQGRVLGDSSLGHPEIGALENHRDRPEVQAALGTGTGASVRLSHTLKHRMLYVALPFHREGKVVGVLRLALPLSQVDLSVGQLRKLLVAATLIALAVAGLVAILAAHRLSRTLRALAHSAGRMVEGDLKERAGTPGNDEIATLGKSLDHLAESLALALAQLKHERDLLRGVLAGMQEGVLVLAADGEVLQANAALQALAKRALGPATTLSSLLILPEFQELLRGTPLPRPALEVDLGGNPAVRVLIQASPLPGEPGKRLLVLVEVTQLRRLESLRRDFVGNASHELRTPVASLRSAAETLRGAMGDPEAARVFLEIIERNADRLHRLISDLLDLTRIESQAYPLEMENLQLADLVASLCLGQEGQAQAKAMRFELALQSAPRIWADHRALEQVLGNLLDNAVKYGPENSRIRIQSRSEGSVILVSVQDEGPGIAAQHLPRLFERFYRVDAGRSRELGGTGLGLAIVKHLTESMGGSVQVESEPGLGSTFTVSLPLPPWPQSPHQDPHRPA